MSELLTAIFLACLTIKFIDYDLSDPKYTNEERKKLRDFVGNFAGIVSVNILLPIIFLESIYSKRESLLFYCGTVTAGCMFAILTFCVGYVISTKFAPERHKRWIDIATATFGGGNRGILLLISTVGVLEVLGLTTPRKEEYLSFFYAFDLGNFISFIFFIGIIIRKRNTNDHGRSIPENQWPFKSIITIFGEKLGLPAIILVLGFIISLLANYFGWPQNVINFVEKTASGRKFMLIYFASIATLLHLELKTQAGEAICDLSFFFFVRILMMSFVFIFSWPYIGGGQSAKIISMLTHPFSVAIIILSLCPPSSLLSPQIEKYGNSTTALTAVSSFSLLSNVAFFVILGGITFLSFVLHFV